MNGLDEIGVVRERLSRGGLIPLEGRHERALLPLQSGELEPRQGLFEGAPEPFTRAQLWTVGRPAHEAYVGRQGEPLGRMGPAVVQEQEVAAVREGLCEGMPEARETPGMQIRQCQEAPLTSRGCHGAIAIGPLTHVLHPSGGLHATRGEAPPASVPAAPCTWPELDPWA